MAEPTKQRGSFILVFLAGLALTFSLVLWFFYFRQRMFTRTEPIVLNT